MISRHTRPLFLVAFAHLVIELCSQYLPVIYPILMDTLGINYTQVGVLALVASTGTTLVQPLFGYLGDLWDPRRIAALSVAWIGLIMGIVGLMDRYGLLVLAIGLGVLGSAAFHPPGVMIASSSVETRRGAAVSVFSVGGNLGSALSPLLITAGIEWLGIRGTVVLIPVALLFSALLYWQLGQAAQPDGIEPAGRRDVAKRGNLTGLVLVVLAVMCLSWFQISFRTYLPSWLESQGRSLVAMGRLTFVFTACASVGSLVGGALSDRIGRWQSLLLCLVLLGPALWFFVGATGSLQVVLMIVMGILIGATFPVSIVMAQETWTSGVGIASGLVMGLGWLPGGVGASFTGYVADRLSLGTGLRLLIVPAALGAGFTLFYAITRRTSAVKERKPTSSLSDADAQ